MKIHSTLAVAAVLILATSCSAGTSGIFASIEREQKVVSLGGISKTATVTSMAELTSVSPHLYFATGGRSLFIRSAGTVPWNKTTVDGKPQVIAVGSTGGPAGAHPVETIFAVAANGDGSGATLYKYDQASGLWPSVPGLGGDTPSGLVPIRTSDGYTNDELLLVTYVGSPPSYQNVYVINNSGVLGPSINLASGLGSLSANVTSAVFTGVTYYFASESYLWSSDGTTANKVATSGGAIHGYKGLLYFGGTLYLSTISKDSSGGGLYSATLPSLSFTGIGGSSNNESVKSSSGSPVSFAQFLFNTTNNSIWVATGATTLTEGTGYMEFTPGSSTLQTTPNTDSNNYNSTVLPNSAVGVLFADHESTTSPNYFLGTFSQGLWGWSNRTWIQQ